MFNNIAKTSYASVVYPVFANNNNAHVITTSHHVTCDDMTSCGGNSPSESALSFFLLRLVQHYWPRPFVYISALARTPAP